MKERFKNIILYSIVGIFLFMLLCATIFYFQFELYIGLLWLCYTAITLMVIGIIFKKPNLILSQVMIIMIPDLFWIVDFFGILITGNSILGITTYFFDNNFLLKKNLTLQHIFTFPLAVLALSIIKIKPNNKILLISLGEMGIFFLISLFLLPPAYGINCLPIPTTCTSFEFSNFIPYPIIWLGATFSFIIISYFSLISLTFLKKDKIDY
ncbi:MAG: hypothetical protein AABW47_00910 [Nanoarchaeota archaeon]